MCNVPQTLKFSWKASELSLPDLMVLCLSLLCDLEVHLARVSSIRSLDCCLSPSSFPKPSLPSRLSPTWRKRSKCSLVLTYSIVLLKYALLKTCTKPHEGPIAHENQFLVLHCLKLSHSPRHDRELMGVLFLSSWVPPLTSSQVGFDASPWLMKLSDWAAPSLWQFLRSDTFESSHERSRHKTRWVVPQPSYWL